MKSNTQHKEKRILIVEDDAAYRALVLAALRKSGLHCTLCINGDQAKKKIQQENYDLIVLDYLLPGPNAIEIVRWLRNEGISAPVLIVTNFPSEELHQKVKALNSTSLIAKSAFDPASMTKIVLGMITS